MKKDIQIPVVENVHIAIVHEWNKDFSSMDWNSYLINNSKEPLETAIIMTRGKHTDGRKTSVLRHAFKVVPARSAVKIELMMQDIFSFVNEFILTYFQDGRLYDKTFVAQPHQISEKNFYPLPVIEHEGILLD